MSFNGIDPVEMTYERVRLDGSRLAEMTVMMPGRWKPTQYGVEWRVAQRTTILIPWGRVVSLTQVDTRERA